MNISTAHSGSVLQSFQLFKGNSLKQSVYLHKIIQRPSAACYTGLEQIYLVTVIVDLKGLNTCKSATMSAVERQL